MSPTGKARYPTRGAELLCAYLDKHEISLSAAAELFGCARSYVSHMRTRRARPGGALAARIDDATGGAVPIKTWYETAHG